MQKIFPSNLVLTMDNIFIKTHGNQANFLDIKIRIKKLEKSQQFIPTTTVFHKQFATPTSVRRDSSYTDPSKFGNIRGEAIRLIKLSSSGPR